MTLSATQKTILSLLGDGQFHSGTELAEQLKISRSAIWKYVNDLETIGLAISAVSGKGYRLDVPLELLDKELILANLQPPQQSLVNQISIFAETPSTNSYLMERCMQNAPAGEICFAERQTAGKGRRGRNWVSPFGSNIYLSVLWRFQASPIAISGLSLALGVAVIRALKELYLYNFQLKWPNDIFYQDKKLGGILVEVTGESEGPCAAVIGLGLNTYLPESAAESITQDWTDLSQIIGQPTNRNNLAGCLLKHLLTVLAEFDSLGIGAYLNEWREHDCLKHKPATLYIGQHSYEGTVQGINDDGLLLLNLANGNTQAFASGEVSFRKP